MSREQKIGLEIAKLLIESGLSIDDQLIVINNVRKKLEFCKIKGREIEQIKIKL
jgi:hypothetical protein